MARATAKLASYDVEYTHKLVNPKEERVYKRWETTKVKTSHFQQQRPPMLGKTVEKKSSSLRVKEVLLYASV